MTKKCTKSAKRLPIDWSSVKALYTLGTMSNSKICEQYKADHKNSRKFKKTVSVASVQRTAKEKGWEKGSTKKNSKRSPKKSVKGLPSDGIQGELSNKQCRFCEEYVIDFNGTRAYLKAYPNVKKPETARACASKLLTKANVSAYINKLKAERSQRTKVTADNVVKELAKVGFYDPRKLYKPDGTLKPIHELDDETAACVVGVEFSQVATRDKKSKSDEEIVKEQLCKVKILDKLKALDMLGKHTGIYEADNEQRAKESQQQVLNSFLEILPEATRDAVRAAVMEKLGLSGGDD